MIDHSLLRAVTAGARAFADALDAELNGDRDGRGLRAPVPGSSESMRTVLEEFQRINDTEHRGVTPAENSQIAAKAGMDPRGLAGYYTALAALLVKKDDGRWITDLGRKRLQQLAATC